MSERKSFKAESDDPLPDAVLPDSTFPEHPLPESPWKRRLIRSLALLMALAVLLLAGGVSLRLLGMPSLGFLLESQELAQDPQIKVWMQAVAWIESGKRQGTGFNIDASGLMVSNAHLVSASDPINIRFRAGETEFSSVHWDASPKADLVLIPLYSQDLPFLELETAKLPQTGDVFTVIGNPLGFFRVASRASYLGVTHLADWDMQVLVLRGPVFKGNSGSPVINEDGRVVGVIFATAGQGQSDEIVAFAIPAAEIARLLENTLSIEYDGEK